MLQAIPIYIVEIIIVKSFDYNLFKELKKFLIKLNEPSRVSRINYKLIISRIYYDNSLEFKLDQKFHNEYDKPAYIEHEPYYEFISWEFYGKSHRINKPCVVTGNDTRCWEYYGLMHRDDDYPSRINGDGGHSWSINGVWARRNKLPPHINVHTRIFDFTDY